MILTCSDCDWYVNIEAGYRYQLFSISKTSQLLIPYHITTHLEL